MPSFYYGAAIAIKSVVFFAFVTARSRARAPSFGAFFSCGLIVLVRRRDARGYAAARTVRPRSRIVTPRQREGERGEVRQLKSSEWVDALRALALLRFFFLRLSSPLLPLPLSLSPFPSFLSFFSGFPPSALALSVARRAVCLSCRRSRDEAGNVSGIETLVRAPFTRQPDI